jgi:hypothetical protein
MRKRVRHRNRAIGLESFKVYDGQIHAVEAFMRILPVEKRDGGWK